MDIKELVDWFDDLLKPQEFILADISMNGLQVGRKQKEITRAAFAVDACLESFQRAVQVGADILFVHHGLFWGKPIALTDTHYQRISYLMEHDLALYASHLPLDAHPEVGNNAGLADKLGLMQRMPFGEYHGRMIGVKGELPIEIPLEAVLDALEMNDEPSISVLPFGRKKIKKVGIISGGAAGEVLQALDEGLDLYITGETAHQIYHTCLEGGINVIAGGHYNTETYGPKLVADRLSAETGIKTSFIDFPTGL
ncbi:MAG: Nif3-like dinuclear metal center hexameric protein [Spirochaetes bacterium]|nr:Nif3-like dinuclear metal center hexameric protein [Spirochaetota bacterium]MBL7005604.1 Nif3-like dinuclear metal center hexameric protein [Spirochaetia bacterium]